MKKDEGRDFFSLLAKKKSDFWVQEGRRKSLQLFHEAAKRVPAYRDFLRKRKISVDKVKTWEDFQSVPLIDRKNYLSHYPLEKLLWDGKLLQPLVFAATSGSTGKPFYFARGEVLEKQAADFHELFIRNSRANHDKSVLVVVCFGMGVWIGGIITYQAFRDVADRGYALNIITPGVNKKEIFESLRNLGPKYDEIIICGYPPFIKDLIDEGRDNGVRWSKLHLKIIFAAEGFSEKFRQYIVHHASIQSAYRDTMNIYGSADLGTMAVETPVSILMRELAFNDSAVFKRLFHNVSRLPTFAQFNPQTINFEEVRGRVVCTGNSVLPLVRYDIGDQGGVLTFREAMQAFADEGVDIKTKLKNLDILKTVNELPFVYIYERADMSTKLYGAIIYPEHIRDGLNETELEHQITTRFTMSTELDKSENEYLAVNVELRPGVTPSKNLKERISKCIVRSLSMRNAEYKNNANMMPGRVKPHIICWRYEHPRYFQRNNKQKWLKK